MSDCILALCYMHVYVNDERSARLLSFDAKGLFLSLFLFAVVFVGDGGDGNLE